MPQFVKDAGSGQLYIGATALWRCRNKTMKSLASDLADRLGAPVTDATSLEGEFDYMLTFTPEAASSQGNGVVLSPLPPPASPGPIAGGDGASAPMEHPLLRDALQEQLGLKLRRVKDVSVDVIVIDDAKREPTEN